MCGGSTLVILKPRIVDSKTRRVSLMSKDGFALVPGETLSTVVELLIMLNFMENSISRGQTLRSPNAFGPTRTDASSDS